MKRKLAVLLLAALCALGAVGLVGCGGPSAVDEEAGTAVVDVKLTCKTFAEIFNTMMEDALALAEDPAAATMTQDELNAKLGEVMMGAVDGAELQETELKLDVVRDDDGTWNWDDTAEDEVTAALMGDF